MVLFPNAKINLGLNILEKRTDGFHNIETVFYPVPLADILEVLPGNGLDRPEFKLSGLDIPGDITGNLCLKAYNMLLHDFDIPPVRIILHKKIPMGAGLGGGSSDGAFMLIALNKIYNLGLGENKLLEYSSRLGSDCAFFIKNQPAIGKGKGNELESLDFSLKGYYIVLIKPDVHVGTADAYAGVRPYVPALTVGTIIKQPIESWKSNLINDFETGIFNKYPEIESIKKKLYEIGAVYASMTGSGAAVYGIFCNEVEYSGLYPDYFSWGGYL